MKKILPDDHENVDAKVGCTVILETNFVDLSDCLLRLTNKDDPFANDVDVKDTEDEGKDVSDVHSGIESTSLILTCREEKMDDIVVAPSDVDESYALQIKVTFCQKRMMLSPAS